MTRYNNGLINRRRKKRSNRVGVKKKRQRRTWSESDGNGQGVIGIPNTISSVPFRTIVRTIQNEHFHLRGRSWTAHYFVMFGNLKIFLPIYHRVRCVGHARYRNVIMLSPGDIVFFVNNAIRTTVGILLFTIIYYVRNVFWCKFDVRAQQECTPKSERTKTKHSIIILSLVISSHYTIYLRCVFRG